jgi:hypothetical protein
MDEGRRLLRNAGYGLVGAAVWVLGGIAIQWGIVLLIIYFYQRGAD